MRFSKTPLQGAWLIKLESFEDSRGSLTRLFCQDELKKIGFQKSIVQMNQSFTKKKGALRGLHFQFPPKAEIKLIRCLRGSVYDVMVDLRTSSPTFLKWHGEVLSEANKRTFLIPEGFAHGFQTLEENCELLYLHTEPYSPSHEGALRFDDPALGITWPLQISELSERDKSHPYIKSDYKGIDP